MSKVSTKMILSDEFVSLPDKSKLLYFNMLFLFWQESSNEVPVIVCKRITMAEDDDIENLIKNLFLYQTWEYYNIIRNEDERTWLISNMSSEERQDYLDYKSITNVKN